MSILDSIITTQPEAPSIILYGAPGIGKSTLAAQFPDALFVLTEDNALTNIKALPIAHSYVDVWNNVKALLEIKDLPFKTIVVDSITALDALVVARTISESPPGKRGEEVSTIAQAFGGYGAGFLKAASLHRALKAKFDLFKERGIAVVYIAHVEIKKFKSPEAEDFDTFSIAMNSDLSRSVYINNVDMVAFCKLKSNHVSTESGRTIVKSTNKRVIYSGVSDLHVSKNRFAIPDEIEMSYAAIAKHIPFYNKDKK